MCLKGIVFAIVCLLGSVWPSLFLLRTWPIRQSIGSSWAFGKAGELLTVRVRSMLLEALLRQDSLLFSFMILVMILYVIAEVAVEH